MKWDKKQKKNKRNNRQQELIAQIKSAASYEMVISNNKMGQSTDLWSRRIYVRKMYKKNDLTIK